jgi:hypothetical protein
LYSDEADLFRMNPHRPRRQNEIGKTDRVNRKPGAKRSKDFLPFHGINMPRLLAEVNRVNKDDPSPLFNHQIREKAPLSKDIIGLPTENPFHAEFFRPDTKKIAIDALFFHFFLDLCFFLHYSRYLKGTYPNQSFKRRSRIWPERNR